MPPAHQKHDKPSGTPTKKWMKQVDVGFWTELRPAIMGSSRHHMRGQDSKAMVVVPIIRVLTTFQNGHASKAIEHPNPHQKVLQWVVNSPTPKWDPTGFLKSP